MNSSGCIPVLPVWVSPFGDPRVLMPVCGSPRLIAACHVLHRLLLPRHPPCALSSLTIKFTHAHRSLQSELPEKIPLSFSCGSYTKRSRTPHQPQSKALIKF